MSEGGGGMGVEAAGGINLLHIVQNDLIIENFDTIDGLGNQDGQITEAELAQYYAENYPDHVVPDFSTLMTTYNTDGVAGLSISELSVALATEVPVNEDTYASWQTIADALPPEGVTALHTTLTELNDSGNLPKGSDSANVQQLITYLNALPEFISSTKDDDEEYFGGSTDDSGHELSSE